jgi:hypothetical protein
MVDSSDATVGATIEGKQVTDLPLNGRNFTQLAMLTPGVTRGAYGDVASGGGSSNYTETARYNESEGAALSVNGLRPQADNFLLDGVDNNDGLVNTILFFPDIDATQEFKVNTNVAPAEYGRAGGAIVMTSIKSGTNNYHGSAFWFYRDQNFDSNYNYQFNGAGPTPPSAFLRQQPGFSIGGPVWPKLKNKLFIFGDYQAFPPGSGALRYGAHGQDAYRRLYRVAECRGRRRCRHKRLPDTVSVLHAGWHGRPNQPGPDL